MEFCYSCKEQTNYYTRKEYESRKIKGRIVNYRAWKAYCKECGSEMYVGYIRRLNKESLEAEYIRQVRQELRATI